MHSIVTVLMIFFFLMIRRPPRSTLFPYTTLFRSDGEPAALLPGAGRLDGRVERQEVGLERDLVDDRDDLRDPLRRSGDLVHRGDRRGDDLAAPLGRVTRLHRELTRSEERRVGKECRSRWSP